MILTFKTAHGYLSFQPDGRLEYRDTVGPWEQVEIPNLVVKRPPDPTVPTEPQPPNPTLTDQEQFMAWVAGKPFGQQTLLDLEPTLNAAGWQLTPPNAQGDRTKVKPVHGPWTRVGFGEGYWVWIPQIDD